jgi:mannosylglycoprotein endo-beta-mannosidase
MFQTWWFGVPGFLDLVKGKLDSFLSEFGPHRGSIELWMCVARLSRQFLKGWGANLGKEKRDRKDGLLAQVEALDALADSSGLDEEGWAFRYHLEDQVVLLDSLEEEYWRQRSRIQWLLKGDACTAYFHAIANGRRRKCGIPRLVSEQGELSDQTAIMEHVYDYYRQLMGSAGEARAFTLAHDLWPSSKRVSDAENLELERSFTLEELDAVLHDMKVDSAPGPDGMPVAFFLRFWGTLRPLVFQILNDFALGRVDISRLNFGILSLIPKVKGADSIKQFRPIALINVIFKFVSKAYASRLASLAHRTIDRTQSAFIKGRALHK